MALFADGLELAAVEAVVVEPAADDPEAVGALEEVGAPEEAGAPEEVGSLEAGALEAAPGPEASAFARNWPAVWVPKCKGDVSGHSCSV